MKQLVVFCALFVISVTSLSPNLRVKFDVGIPLLKNFFFEIPLTKSDAISEGWNKTERPSGPLPQLESYCYPDKIVCALYDDTENVAGLQVALPQDSYTDSPFDWKTLGYTEWAPAVADGEAVKKYWTIQQYFVSEESLQQKSKEERLASRDKKKFLQEDAVWLTGFNGEVMKVPSSRKEIENAGFTKQACIPEMGRHFYYNMSSELSCDSNTMYPWFPLVHSGDLVAVGLATFGKLPTVKGERDWFERPPRLAVKAIVPRGPECLYDLASNPGLVTMHIYYVDKPWLIGCILQ